MEGSREQYEEEITATISKEHYFNFPEDIKANIKVLGVNPKHDLYETDSDYKKMANEISRLKKVLIKYRNNILEQ